MPHQSPPVKAWCSGDFFNAPQRGQLPLVERGEALGFFAESVERGDDLFLLRRW